MTEEEQPWDEAAARERHAAATPGPYAHRPERSDDWGWIRAADGDLVATTCMQNRYDHATAHTAENYEPGRGYREPDIIAANGRFVAGSWGDLQGAFAELDRLRGELAFRKHQQDLAEEVVSAREASLAAVQAENARLREALERAIGIIDMECDALETVSELRAALGPPKAPRTRCERRGEADDRKGERGSAPYRYLRRFR